MRNQILKAAWALAACLPAAVTAQDMKPHREGSFEFSLGGGFLLGDPALRDFLGSGAPESRFANSATPSRGAPTAVFRLGYNFSRNVGFSVSAGGARGSGITYLTPTAALTFTGNLNATTSPFLLVGTELTRISGQNGRVTHSTWGAHAGLGLRNMISDNVALRLEGRLQFEGYREVPMRKRTTVNPLLQLGLSIFTGGHHPPMAMPMAMTPAPAPAPVERLPGRIRVDTVRSVRVDTVRLSPTASTDQVVLRVQFQTDKAELLPISRPVLDTVAAAIIATPGSRWQVEGHTDSVGTAEYNKTLSQARAQTVVDYLVSKGVDRGIMTAVGFGFDREVFSNTTLEGRAQNRRVQLRRIPLPPKERVP